jgi:antitoxin MazE
MSEMLVSVVPIGGDSKRIKIPQKIIEEFNIGSQIELEIRKKKIILKPPTRKPRQGWNKSFKKLHENNDDLLLIPDTIENQSFSWEW